MKKSLFNIFIVASAMMATAVPISALADPMPEDPVMSAKESGQEMDSAVREFKVTNFKYSTIGIGLGLSVPVDNHERLAAELIINWKWLHLFFHDIEGMGLSVNSRLILGRVTLMPICLGVMWHYDGDAYEMIGRSNFEFVTPVLLELRATERLQIRVSVTWHWPNPFTAYSEAKRIVREEIDEFIGQVGEMIEGNMYITDIDAPAFSRVSGIISNSYVHALHNPRIGISMRWYIF